MTENEVRLFKLKMNAKVAANYSTNFVRDQDFFGAQVSLFAKQKNKDTHHTLFGGFVSLCLKVSMFFYLLSQFKAMMMYENNIVYDLRYLIDLAKEPPI